MDGATPQVRIVTAILILAMSATTFLTQRQLTMKNMPASALDNPMARQQKMLMYIFPVIFAVTGVNFPIGVLIYWTTTNLWSMGQQFYVIRNMPAPGSEAEKKYQERMARKEARRAARRGVLGGGSAAGGAVLEDSVTDVAEENGPVSGQRQQPTSKKRAKKKGLPKPATAAGTDGEQSSRHV
ncbi:YidC/Oxa1 family membrane protein insertase [Salana multivorans]